MNTLLMGILASGILMTSLTAGEINVKKVDDKTPAVVAPKDVKAVIPTINSNIKVDIQTSKTNQISFPALKDDLVNTGSPTLSKISHENFKQFGACHAKSLNDGTVGSASAQGSVMFDLDGKWTTTFVLDTAKAAKGYDVTEITTIAGWPPNRACQKYELLISKASAPDKFVSQGIFEVDAKNAHGTQIKLTGKNNIIESNVAAVKFDFMKLKSAAGGASETTYREIDIVGTPSK